MPSTNEVPLAPRVNEQRSALDAVLRSRTFAKNPRLRALLDYLCTSDTDSIKEYNIATDVFGRPADFDQSTDAIVRVEMHRLRKKLKEYYASEGESAALEIIIRPGHYLPDFVARAAEAAPVQSETREEPFEPIAATPDPQPHELEPPHTAPDRARTGARNKTTWIAGGLVAAAVLAVLVFGGFRKSTASVPRASSPSVGQQAAAPQASPAQQPGPAVLPASGAVRILCGSTSGYRDRAGNAWAPDAYYTGGTIVPVTDELLYRTRDSGLFRAMRSGEFSYNIPLKAGVYEMRLYFSDPAYSPGIAMEGGENTRVFNVALNGKSILRDFDIIADAGPKTADVRVFKDVEPARDGCLHLSFSKDQGVPLVNAIEIVPGIPGRQIPIRIVAQDNAVTDRAGTNWQPDEFFMGGRVIARSIIATGPQDPEIYTRERYGNFSYAIPVSDGVFRATLHFAETYWGPKSPGGGGVGARVFDVYCNGVALMRNFDMLKEAGPHEEISKTFSGLRPNGAGKLLFSFVPVRNYANLSALEVVDESESRRP